MLDFVLGYTAGRRTASQAASLARSAAAVDGTIHTNKIEDLRQRVDRLAMVVSALWHVLEDAGFTTDQLEAKLRELDLADGEADGRMRQLPLDCRSCGSKVAPGLSNCQFCGGRVRVDDDDHPLDDM